MPTPSRAKRDAKAAKAAKGRKLNEWEENDIDSLARPDDDQQITPKKTKTSATATKAAKALEGVKSKRGLNTQEWLMSDDDELAPPDDAQYTTPTNKATELSATAPSTSSPTTSHTPTAAMKQRLISAYHTSTNNRCVCLLTSNFSGYICFIYCVWFQWYILARRSPTSDQTATILRRHPR